MIYQRPMTLDEVLNITNLIRQMKVKTTIWHHFKPCQMSKVKKIKLTLPNAGENLQLLEFSYFAMGYIKY